MYYDTDYQIIGREEQVNRVINTLVREKSKNAVLTGEAGVGKTAVAEKLVEAILFKNFPDAKAFHEVLGNAVVIQTTPAKISALAKSNDPASQQAAMEQYVKSLLAAKKEMNREIILFIDEIHNVTQPQWNALKPVLDSQKGILLVGATTNREHLLMVKNDEAIERRIEPITVPELTVEEAHRVLKESIVPRLERRYGSMDGRNGKIEDGVINSALRLAPLVHPNLHRPDGPYKVLMDAMINEHAAAGVNAPTLTEDKFQNFVVKKMGLPLNPTKLDQFEKDLEKLRNDVKKEVGGQFDYIDGLADLWHDSFLGTDPKTSIKTLFVAGKTGTGKTHIAKRFAKYALGTEERVLEIDANLFKTGEHSLNALFGAPPGIISSDEKLGIIPEFLAGRGKGYGIIIINEIDKASKDFLERMMEFMDTGVASGADGKAYKAGKCLLVFTSNKNDERVHGGMSESQIKELLTKADARDKFDQSNTLHNSIGERINRAVVVEAYTKEQVLGILQQRVNAMKESYKTNFDVDLEIVPEALQRLVDDFYNENRGVRAPLDAVLRLVNASIRALSKADENLASKTIQITLNPGDEKAPYKASVVGTKTEVAVAPPGLKPQPAGILKDSELLDRLMNLEAKLNENVFGQEHVAKQVSERVQTSIIIKDKKPATFIMAGPTGTGKTETAKQIADARYGDAKAVVQINMGEVRFEGDLNNILGSARGYKGSDTDTEFERFLQKHPEGGVVIWDEIGNMAGGDPKEKNKLLKTAFYKMIDEGIFTSNTGETYDLSKFTFVFTTNEMQEFFESAPTDDLREAAWRANNTGQNLYNTLRDRHGWPEPLLARIGVQNILLYKPLLADAREKIIRKFFAQVRSTIKQDIPIKDITFDERFFTLASDAFFSHTQGARGMRDIVEQSMSSLITKAIFAMMRTPGLQDANFHFTLQDNYFGQRFANRDQIPPDRVVEVTLQVSGPGVQKPIVIKDNLTSRANDRKLVAWNDARVVAYHEAAHVIANRADKTGQAVEFATIIGADSFGGYARYVPDNKLQRLSQNREEIVFIIASLLAGRVAESMIGVPENGGWSSDKSKAEEIATRAVVEMGITRPGQEWFKVNEKGKVNVNDPRVQAEITAFLDEGKDKALQLLQERWSEVHAVHLGLMAKGSLTKGEIDGLIRFARSPEYAKALQKFGLDVNATPTAETSKMYPSLKYDACNLMQGKMTENEIRGLMNSLDMF